MKFLVVGLGSAGQRYARVIREKFPNSDIYVFRGNHYMGLISRDLVSIENEVDPVDFYGLIELNRDSLKSFLFDFVVIATPVNSHFEYLKILSKQSKKILIEKPICANLNEFNAISEIRSRFQLMLFAGYQHRFNPLFIDIKNQIKCLNKPIQIEFVHQESLHQMNRFRNMDGHHLATPQGGGVVLALSHELERLFDFFPNLRGKIDGNLIKSSEFDGVFDTANYFCTDANGFSLKGKTSFSSGSIKREGRIFNQELEIKWDLLSKTLEIKNLENSNSTSYDFDSDKLSNNLLEDFLNRDIWDEVLEESFQINYEIIKLSEKLKAKFHSN